MSDQRGAGCTHAAVAIGCASFSSAAVLVCHAKAAAYTPLFFLCVLPIGCVASARLYRSP